MTSHCTLIGVQKDTNLYTVYRHYEDLKSPGFHKEITRLQAITEKPQDTSNRAMIHLQLALLYSHYKNPTPNYYRALKELETYVSLYPEGGKADVIQNWLTMLKEIVKLSMENKDMKEKLEQLQNLDIELEKTRKLLK
jgi:DNA-binding transcriptional regulator YhcF (GntR family)